MRNEIQFEVFGDYGLFTDPLSNYRGEKLSYPIPTYSALKGIVDSIFRSEDIIWIIDEIRVMNSIRFESKSVNPIIEIRAAEEDEYKVTYSPSNYTYLYKPHYQVKARFVAKNESVPINVIAKNFNRAKRYLNKGGRKPIFLGTSECVAYVEPCVYGETSSYYDELDIDFEKMVHSIIYPSAFNDLVKVAFWDPVMKNGRVKFCLQEECNNVFPLTDKYIFKNKLNEE